MDDEIVSLLRDHGDLESDDDFAARQAAFDGLVNLVDAYVELSLCSRALPLSLRTRPVRVFPFGSCRLGTQERGGDVDVVVCACRHIPRKQFFADFKHVLLADPAVSFCQVPLLNF
jgi:poly(A) polymerase Pap1